MDDFMVISVLLFMLSVLPLMTWVELHTSKVRMSLWKYNRIREVKILTVVMLSLSFVFLFLSIGN